MPKHWRLIQSGFQDAYANMAIDEAIFFKFSEKSASPVLRIYGWTPAAFSLGCSQKPQETLDIQKCSRENIPFVRRITAGGIIFHDQELTYSLACAQDDIQAFGSVGESFRIICSFLIKAYRKLNLHPVFAKEVIDEAQLTGLADFCFSSCAKYDILIDGKKIGGNAQRRKKNLIFQHGSIPIVFDSKKALAFLKKQPAGLGKSICSLTEALGKNIEFSHLSEVLIKSFAETFSVELINDCLSPEEEELASDLKKDKYSQPGWNIKRDEYCFFKTALAG